MLNERDTGYGMLARLDVGADACLFHLVIDDNLVGIAIQRHALSKLIFGCNDNLFATRELNRALGCTTVRVELAYGMLHSRMPRKKKQPSNHRRIHSSRLPRRHHSLIATRIAIVRSTYSC